MLKSNKVGLTFNEVPGKWDVINTYNWRDDEELWLVERVEYGSFEETMDPMIVSYGGEKIIVKNAPKGFEDLPNPFEVELRLQGYLNRAAYGGGPLIYLMGDSEDLVCPACAEKDTEAITVREIYYEGPVMHCEDCGTAIHSAYGDPYQVDDEFGNPINEEDGEEN